MKALIIYSGGMDSTVLLHKYKDNIDLAISFYYGSKHNEREYKSAQSNTKVLNIEHEKINLGFLNDHLKSDLLNSGGDVPDGHYEEPSMKRTVVPFRNAIMLSIAVGIAESRGLDTILLGSHAGDHAIYPDCRPDFTNAFSLAAQAGTYGKIQVIAPFQNITKREIGIIGHKIGIDFDKTYTCYNGGDRHCGKCGACTERKEALEGFDPTIYES